LPCAHKKTGAFAPAFFAGYRLAVLLFILLLIEGGGNIIYTRTRNATDPAFGTPVMRIEGKPPFTGVDNIFPITAVALVYR